MTLLSLAGEHWEVGAASASALEASPLICFMMPQIPWKSGGGRWVLKIPLKDTDIAWGSNFVRLSSDRARFSSHSPEESLISLLALVSGRPPKQILYEGLYHKGC